MAGSFSTALLVEIMKNNFFILVSFFPVQVSACPDILGEWRSSYELSKTFNDKYAVIEERTKEFREQLIGRSTVTYTKESVALEMDPIDSVTISGKVYPWDSSPMTGPYRALGCNDDIVVIKINFNGTELLSSLNFESENIYWVYEGTPKGAGNKHTREYFVRKKSN